MKNYILIALILPAVMACNHHRPITAYADYDSFLQPASLVSNNQTKEEIDFWAARLAKETNDEASLLKLAGLYAQRFRESGVINDIVISDSLYHFALKDSLNSSIVIYQGLAVNAVAQHKFKSARDYAHTAVALKDNKASTLLLLVDVSIERGDYAVARQLLSQFTNKSSFAFLIRKAKLKDQEGDLAGGIELMERAYRRIQRNKILAAWTLSNLADMYTHAGRIEEAYQLYLEVLRDNPEYDHALKGIAWIAISHDHNTTDSKKILQFLSAQKRMPEAYLMMAEAAGLEGNDEERTSNFRQFIRMASTPAYRTMYSRYLAVLAADEFDDPERCVSIAKKEIANRPTPQSYDLLAWGYYQQNNMDQALDIVRRHVERRTDEPIVNYHLGMIYYGQGDASTSSHYLRKALAGKIELGPNITKIIENTLQHL